MFFYSLRTWSRAGTPLLDGQGGPLLTDTALRPPRPVVAAAGGTLAGETLSVDTGHPGPEKGGSPVARRPGWTGGRGVADGETRCSTGVRGHLVRRGSG